MSGQGGQNQVTATGMEKITTTPGHAPVAHFVSGLDECEKKTVVWKIQNIAELLKMSAEKMMDNGITFDAGHSIGIPATWNFYFTRNGSVARIVNYLHLTPDSKARDVKVSCSISMSCEGETIASADLNSRELKAPLLTKARWEYGHRFGKVWPLTLDSDILQKTDNGQKALKVTLTVKVFSGKNALKTPKARVLKKGAVISDLEKLLESGDGADVEIRVPSEEVVEEVDSSSYKRMVHKPILMARSSVFSKMFAKESEMVEAKTGKVVIKDLSPKGLDIFLYYIYTEKVLDEWVKVPEKIINCAEKYDVGRLKNYCSHKIMAAVSISNALEMYRVAKLHKLSFAKRAIAEFISRNTRAVLDDGDEDDTTTDEESDTE